MGGPCSMRLSCAWVIPSQAAVVSCESGRSWKGWRWWPAPAELPQFCSCGDIACPTPACHPIGTLTARDATADLGQLGRWWLAHPTANLATITDERVGVIELHHPAKPDALLYAMKEHHADQAPMVHAGQGVMSLLVKPNLGLDDSAVEVAFPPHL